jgi:hypothetical protein
MRPSPGLGAAVEDILRAIRGKVGGQRGGTLPAQRVSGGEILLTVQHPTMIQPCTEGTERRAHMAVLPVSVPLRG